MVRSRTRELTNLPKARQKRPDIVALGLKVYQTGAHSFQVPGRQKVYDVFLVDNTVHCTCTAASFGVTCSHSLAVQRYLKETY